MNGTAIVHGLHKSDHSIVPRYKNKRVDDIYPVKKPTFMSKPLFGNTGKENVSNFRDGNHNNGLVAEKRSSSSWDASSVPSTYRDEHSYRDSKILKISEKLEVDDIVEERDVKNSDIFMDISHMPKEHNTNVCSSSEKCRSSNTFFNVAELSMGHKETSGLFDIDMGKALRGLVGEKPSAPSRFQDNHSAVFKDLHISTGKIPLDYTLKTSMRVLSSTPVNWFHRLMACDSHNNMVPFSTGLSYPCDEKSSHFSDIHGREALKAPSFHSWVYPQTSFSPSVISALASSLAGGDMDFLNQRRLAWEDSFRSLYYMLRRNVCRIFYVCTLQFVVMFAVCHNSQSKPSCNAYISRSTTGLRSLLREHDVGYVMPLCNSKEESVTADDLVELSEMERSNLSQARRTSSMLDNSPESQLAFIGNKSVHGLYDILLNYRFLLTFLSGVDVPILYSPIPFQNAAISTPEVRCREAKTTDQIAFNFRGCDSGKQDSSTSHGPSPHNLSHTIEIKSDVLPLWVVSNICSAMAVAAPEFQVSFSTEPASMGLNAALEGIWGGDEGREEGGEGDDGGDGLKGVVFCPSLGSGFVKGLKYINNSYTASLSQI